MAIQYDKELVLLEGLVSVEDAEQLLEHLQGKAHAQVDFSQCSYVHPANIQVLLAAGVTVRAWPGDAALAGWLQSVFPVQVD
jgi:hypothetical protein